jgi:peptidyl-prolyl cis-trans isomerase SurA
MSRQEWTTTALVAFALAICGCTTSQPRWGAADGAPPVSLPPPRAQGERPDAPLVARSQKPEADGLKTPEAPPLPTAPPADLVTGQPAARVGATVNNEAILNEEVLAGAFQPLMAARELQEPERSQRRAEIWNQALSQLVEREVVLQDAFAKLKKGSKSQVEKFASEAAEQFDRTVLRGWMKRADVKTEEEFRELLKSQGVSLDMLRRQWERNFMTSEYLRNRIHAYIDQVGPQQILEYYDKHPEEFQRPDAVQWQDLFVLADDKFPTRADAHRLAEQLAQRARGGEDFAKLAEKYDKGDSSFRKGDGIGAKRGEIKPAEAENVLFQLKDRETAVVELEKGFHVVRLVKRDYAGQTPFDEKTQKQIKEKLTNEIGQVEMKRIVNKLKRDAVIVYTKGDTN